MSQSQSSSPFVRVSNKGVNSFHPLRIPPQPLTDPYDICFYAVARALKGKPGCLVAMQAITAAKVDYRRHVLGIEPEYWYEEA